MNSPSPVGSSDAAALDPVIAEVRTRFVAEFPLRCDLFATLLEGTADPDTRAESAQSFRALAHRLAGLAGLIGFPRVSALAAELETMAGDLEAGRGDAQTTYAAVQAMRAAFAHELACPPGSRPDASRDLYRGDVLVVEDDEDQCTIVTSQLAEAGYRTHAVRSGDEVLRAARAIAPAVILLDIEMPGMDGYSVCRELKADPELASLPVVFVTTRAQLDDRLAGLTLGADEYLVKPVDPRELILRIERVKARDRARAEQASAAGILSYEEFLRLARTCLSHSPAALVLLRVPADQREDAIARVTGQVRRADLVAPYDRTHVVVLLPDTSGAAACSRTDEIVNRLVERGIHEVVAGVAYSEANAAGGVDSMLAQADTALMQARYCRRMVVLYGENPEPVSQPAGASILVADDDPDVMRILDATLRGAGHHATLVFDGGEALASLERNRPDVLVLDLMMPRLGGFDLLYRLNRSTGPRPRIIVLSARGREEDVTRAFELGADDYVTKPFNPQELLARIARLLR